MGHTQGCLVSRLPIGAPAPRVAGLQGVPQDVHCCVGKGAEVEAEAGAVGGGACEVTTCSSRRGPAAWSSCHGARVAHIPSKGHIMARVGPRGPPGVHGHGLGPRGSLSGLLRNGAGACLVPVLLPGRPEGLRELQPKHALWGLQSLGLEPRFTAGAEALRLSTWCSGKC